MLELIWLFFRLGLTAFGGPAAHIAMMEEEFVTKRKWLTREHFLDLIGATNLIPGPNSTEMTMHIGYERKGIPGLFAAGLSFIIPAVCLTGLLAYFYVKYGSIPEVQPFIYGIKPIVLALIAKAVLKLGKKAVKNWELAILGCFVITAAMLGVHEILALGAAGVLGMIYFSATSKRQINIIAFPMLVFLSDVVIRPILESEKVFLIFLKVGAILYGSGYVLFAYLDAELVSTGIMERSELVEAIAVGQFTPGPVLSTATFVGYQLSGFGGAIAASIGVFLPSFLFVLILNPLIPRLRKAPLFRYFLDSVNVAAVGIMMVVLYEMTRTCVVEWRTATIAIIGFILVFAFKKMSPILLVLSGSLLGYILILI